MPELFRNPTGRFGLNQQAERQAAGRLPAYQQTAGGTNPAAAFRPDSSAAKRNNLQEIAALDRPASRASQHR